MHQNTSSVAQAFVGSWGLISFQAERNDGTVVRPYGMDPQGLIVYTLSGRFSAQLMRRDRPLFVSGDQMRGTPDEIEAAYKGCVSYYGTYTLDAEAGFVVHQVEGSLFPNWEGEAQKRFFALSGNRLTLSTPPIAWGVAGQVVGTLVWERLD